MKTVFKSKIIIIALLTGFLFSCKNNQDGYSDEIETTTPTDSTKAVTGHGEDIGTQSAEATHENPDSTAAASSSGGTTGSGSSTSSGTTGTGSGPGESAKDGSTYTSASGTQKDSTKAGTKSSKAKGAK